MGKGVKYGSILPASRVDIRVRASEGSIRGIRGAQFPSAPLSASEGDRLLAHVSRPVGTLFPRQRALGGFRGTLSPLLLGALKSPRGARFDSFLAESNEIVAICGVVTVGRSPHG